MSFYQDNLDFLKGDLEEVYMDNLLNFRTNTLKEKHVKLRKISIWAKSKTITFVLGLKVY